MKNIKKVSIKMKANKAATPKPKMASKAAQAATVTRGLTAPTRNKKRDNNQLYTYIHKVLKQVHPDTGINTPAIEMVNEFLLRMLYLLCVRINHLLMLSKKQTVSTREVQTATRSLLTGELAKHAISELTKAVTVYNTAKDGGNNGKKGMRAEQRAHLQLPVARIGTMMRQHLGKVRVSEAAPVAMAAVLEYLCAELLELSGNVARDNKKQRISRRAVMLCFSSDQEFDTMIRENKMTIPGGVVPHIKAAYIKKD